MRIRHEYTSSRTLVGMDYVRQVAFRMGLSVRCRMLAQVEQQWEEDRALDGVAIVLDQRAPGGGRCAVVWM